jgi:hypothetical protein
MGTRNLTMVQKGGEIKVAQYGQWDGYPSGQGVTILKFCSIAENLEKLKEKLSQVRFMTDNDAEMLNAKLKANDEKIKACFERLWSRDVGGEILDAIIHEDGEVLLQNEFEFGYDSLFCEWAYCVNLDINKLEVYKGFNKEILPETSRFYKAYPNNGYYGIRKIKEYDLDNLPTRDEFVSELED